MFATVHPDINNAPTAAAVLRKRDDWAIDTTSYSWTRNSEPQGFTDA
jgi:hypothetical protein